MSVRVTLKRRMIASLERRAGLLTATGPERNINKAAAQVEKSVVFQSHLRRPPPFVVCLTHSPIARRGMGGGVEQV